LFYIVTILLTVNCDILRDACKNIEITVKNLQLDATVGICEKEK